MGISYYAYPGIKKSKVEEDADRVEKIVDCVCEYFGVSRSYLFEFNKEGEKSYQRYLMFYFARRYTKLKLREIAAAFVNLNYSRIDHTAIVTGSKKIRNYLSVKDEKTVKDVDELIIKINLI